MMEMQTGVGMVMDVLSILSTFIVLAVAVGVAVVMGRRKQFVGASWVVVVGRAGVWVSTIGYLITNLIVGRVLGFDVGQWLYILLKLLVVGSSLLVTIGLVMYNPKKLAQGGMEVARG